MKCIDLQTCYDRYFPELEALWGKKRFLSCISSNYKPIIHYWYFLLSKWFFSSIFAIQKSAIFTEDIRVRLSECTHISYALLHVIEFTMTHNDLIIPISQWHNLLYLGLLIQNFCISPPDVNKLSDTAIITHVKCVHIYITPKKSICSSALISF